MDEEIHKKGRKKRINRNDKEAMFMYYIDVAKRYAKQIIPNMEEEDRDSIASIALVGLINDCMQNGYEARTFHNLLIHRIEQEYRKENANAYSIEDITVMKALNDTKDSLFMENEKEPSDEEIMNVLAVKLNIPKNKIETVLSRIQRKSNIEEAEQVTEKIQDLENSTPEENAEMRDVIDRLEEALNTLNEREKQIITLRFGINDGIPKTLDETGKIMGLTREGVRQLQSRTILKLIHPNNSRKLEGYRGVELKKYHGNRLKKFYEPKNDNEGGSEQDKEVKKFYKNVPVLMKVSVELKNAEQENGDVTRLGTTNAKSKEKQMSKNRGE